MTGSGLPAAIADAPRPALFHVAKAGTRRGTGGLELDHVEGFARTHVHSVEGIRLLCHVHNLLAAEQM
ncbi:MAG: hypothetical protein ACJ78Y_13940, partial [Myxococcales bacterium]